MTSIIDLDKFHKSTIGFPDHVFLDDDGKPSAEVLRRALGFNRTDSRNVTRFEKSKKVTLDKFLSLHSGRTNRAKLFWLHTGDFRKKGALTFFSSDYRACWETQVFDHVLPGWHLLDSKKGNTSLYSALSDANKNEIEAWFNEYVPLDVLSDSEKKTKSPDIGIEHDQLMECSAEVYLHCLAALDGWENCDSGRRKELAEVAFACFTVLGPSALNCAATKVPELLGYYKYVRGIAHPPKKSNKRGNEKSDNCVQKDDTKESAEPLATLVAAPSTLHDFYGQLFDLAERGKAAPFDASIADEMERLLQHFPQMKEKIGIPDDIIRDVFDAFVEHCITLGADRSLSVFEEDDFLSAFKEAWFAFLNTQLQAPVSVSFFDDLITQATSTFEALSLSITQLREKISYCGMQITKRDQECADAGFKERRELQKAIAALILEKSERVSELAQIEEMAIQALLPAGMTIDDLPSGNEDVILSNSEYHPSAIIAIKERHDAAATSRIESDAIIGAVVAKSNAPAIIAAPSAQTEVSITPSIVPESDPSVTPIAVQAPECVLSIKSVGNEIKTTIENSGAVPEKDEGVEPAQKMVVDENISVNTIDMAEHKNKNDVATTDYSADAVVASAFFVESHNNRGRVSAVAVENVALHWIDLGYLNFAYAALDAAKKVPWVDGKMMDQSLLRAAYFGSHVWPGDQTGISIIQKQLNFISHQVLEESLNRRPGGKLVPYLIFCASFQASIFSGNYTNAPSLLAQVGDYFDNATQRMIADIVSFSNRGHRLDFESLRLRQPIEDGKTQMETLRLRLSDWRHRIINKQTGWAPARKALHDCLSLPDFMETIAAIESGSSSSSNIVQTFVENYTDLSKINSLIESQIQKVQNGVGVPMERNARIWLQKNIEEISEIARDWLIEIRSRLNRNTDTQMFAERLLTQLRTVQAEFQAAMVKRTQGLEHRCGSKITLSCVNNVLKVIEGDTSVIWPTKRVSATFGLADDLFAIDGMNDDSEAQLNWLVENISSPFDLEVATKYAEQARDFRVAQLLLLLRKDRGDNVAAELQEVKKKSDRNLYLLGQKAERVKAMIDNAALVNLIEDERADQISADNDYLLEQIKSLDALDSVRVLNSDLDAWERDLLSRFSGEITKKRYSLDDLLRKARVQFGEEAVSGAWLQQINRALDSQNLPVAEEMLNQLESSIKEGSRLVIEDITPNPYITGFLTAEGPLFEAIKEHRNPREIGKYLLDNPIKDLNFSNPNCVDILERMAEWRSHPKKSLEKTFYDSLVLVLEYIGFKVATKTFSASTKTSLGYEEQGTRFKRASITVLNSDTGRPFPLFEDAQGGASQINVIMAFSDWNVEDLKGYLETLGLAHNRTLLLSAKPMTNIERNEFAASCKKNEITIFHVDPVIAAYMGSLPSNDNRLRNFLFLSAPWTYYNPYTQGDVRRPAPYEMRYGRKNDVQNLTKHGGDAIVFGGRQLGKTTILHEAVRLFNKEQNQHAFYLQMDRDMARLDVVSKNAWMSARERVWAEIYKCVVKAKILPENRYTDLESQITAIGDEFKKDGTSKVLICMDEIDPILKLDHANGFGIFRGISELVNQPNGRFKMVIAGLENVKRFEDAPNFPLPQLGGSLQVSILPTKDAMQLVNEPLRILGYEFDDDLLAARILVTTNRHPGLIHIFCAELLKWMSKRHNDAVGAIKITTNDVVRIIRDPNVNKLIRNRFDMTLNLDKRYLVIIYSLINSQRSIGYFTSSQAKVTSEYWLPNVFKPMTEKTFEAFLDELVGLGVLRPSTDGREFALRSANILNLVGNQTEIEEKLLQTIEDMNFDDPMSGHANLEVAPSNSPHLSPLTFRDEKFLISATAAEIRVNPELTKMYSVAVVAGSEAMGMDVEKLKISLPSLGNFENTCLINRATAYEIKHATDASLKGSAGFRALLENFIKKNTERAAQPLMMLIEVDGYLPLAFTLDLIDIAHEMTSTSNKLKSQIRVLFLLKPKAIWQWELNGALTNGREQLQTFICLDRWSKTALSYLLSQLGLINNAAEVDLLLDYSQGWYFSLTNLIQSRSRYKLAQTLAELTSYVSFENEKSKRLIEFASKTGVTEFEWAPSLLLSLAKNDTFDAEDVATIVLVELEDKYGIDSTMAPAILRWFERLRVVDPMTSVRANRGNIVYRVNPSIVTALKEVSRAGTTL